MEGDATYILNWGMMMRWKVMENLYIDLGYDDEVEGESSQAGDPVSHVEGE